MNLEKINLALKEFSEKKNLNLFEVTYHKNDSTLTVLFDEKFDMNELENVSNELSEFLDKYDGEFEDNYFLDVSTVGVERPIRNEEELIKAIGEYIYVKTKENEYYGTLKSYNNGVLSLDVADKNKTKNISVEYKKVKIVRYAVKF